MASNRANGFRNQRGRHRVTTAAIAKEILKKANFARDPGGHLYVFQQGVYKPEGERHVKSQVKRVLKRWRELASWSRRKGEEVLEYIRLDAPELWDRPPLGVINVRNGLLDTETPELKPHSPKHLSPVQVPINYEPTAECPAWEKFTRDVFPADAQELAWEIPGYLITPDTSIQKAFLLLGDGGNGKSTYLTGLRAFLGPANVSTVSLQDLVSNRFMTAQLVGKLANICPDLPAKALVDTAPFKAITGGDAISAERKFKTAFEFVPYARLIFSANQLPQSKDSSEGFLDRWIIVPFDRSFRGTKQEIPKPILDARLADRRELSGLLNKALEARRRVTTSGRFTESQTTRKALDEFREVTDPFAQWLDQKTETGTQHEVPAKDLLRRYNDDARRQGGPVLTDSQFGKALMRLRTGVTKTKKGPKGQQQSVYVGIGLKP